MVTDPAGAVLAALKRIPELRPAAPVANVKVPWVSLDLDRTAVDVDESAVTVRVVAFALPLPPVLERAEALLRKAIDDAGRPEAVLRLVVVDIDAAAFE
ncbi:hypothetical protein [Kutzneria sp. NPDC052558]|uniref:hypothetical protein n=1 Tax=Kutzneria sp. NPDC052558 TaxID=3364121 RepID=UPI0037C71A61